MTLTYVTANRDLTALSDSGGIDALVFATTFSLCQGFPYISLNLIFSTLSPE